MNAIVFHVKTNGYSKGCKQKKRKFFNLPMNDQLYLSCHMLNKRPEKNHKKKDRNNSVIFVP